MYVTGESCSRSWRASSSHASGPWARPRSSPTSPAGTARRCGGRRSRSARRGSCEVPKLVSDDGRGGSSGREDRRPKRRHRLLDTTRVSRRMAQRRRLPSTRRVLGRMALWARRHRLPSTPRVLGRMAPAPIQSQRESSVPRQGQMDRHRVRVAFGRSTSRTQSRERLSTRLS